MLRGSVVTGMADWAISEHFSKLTFAPPDNVPPFADKPCGSASQGDCLPDGYEGLQTDPVKTLDGDFCDRALPDYTGSEPSSFKSFEITQNQSTSAGVLKPNYHTWLDRGWPLDQIRAIDGTLLSEFLAAQTQSPPGAAWADHTYTATQAATLCSGFSNSAL
jgi:hypothetical protein